MFVPASSNAPLYSTQYAQSGGGATASPKSGGGSMKTIKYGNAAPKKSSPYSSSTETPYLKLHSVRPDIAQNLTWLEQTKDRGPWFYCSYTLDGDRYFGEGRAKKDAKQKLAEKLLPVLLQGNAVAGPALPKNTNNEKTAFMHLNERIAGVSDRLVFTEEFVNKVPHFHCSLTYEGKSYSAEGASKKQAKHALAELLLPIVPQPAASPPKLSQPLGPTFHDKALELFNSLITPEELSKLQLFKLEDLSDPGPAPRAEERLFRCTLSLRDKSFSGSSITKKGAQGMAAIQALQTLFGEDTSKFKDTPSVEFKGHSLYYAAAELCARQGLKASSEMKVVSEAPVAAGIRKTFQFVIKLSGGYQYAGVPTQSKKEAVDTAALKVLKELFKLSDAELEALKQAAI